MIEIIKGLIDLISIYIHSVYNLEVDFSNGVNVKLGLIIVSFVSIVLIIYFVFGSLSFFRDRRDD